ncbi:UBX domain-containing protein 1 [Trypanosoma theileri]|uniref:UBX domain-containing protein 1 n=1 Tax=Trypanosoma theileri TaxID=67003 RepID=A0A1X0NTT3_9TRYP|nr:UBX domain-containing protein 1 [Trypanosoma theileri]ORC87883.1 UBX domain-containing protein 1 [Trypanosoma theileri]
MPTDKNTEVAQLTAYMPWLKHDEALELLERYGGSAESVINFLEEASNAPQDKQTPPPPQQQQQQQQSSLPASKDRQKAEKHFVGGGPSSGQVVLGGEDKVKDVIESIFERARAQTPGEDADGVQAFFGRGRRLGYTTAPSPFIASTAHQHRDIVVTVYRNGYTIDNGPRQEKDSEEGMAFFNALNNGVVPDSVAAMYPNTNISVRLVDCTQQDAPTTHVAFTGEGRRLCSPTTTTTTTAGAGAAEATASSLANAGSGTFQLHEDEETSKLVIVNLLGERKEFTVNPKRHTVGDLFILAAQHAQPGAVAFQLIARDIPPRPLQDTSLTIDAAKLRNATVIMRRV